MAAQMRPQLTARPLAPSFASPWTGPWILVGAGWAPIRAAGDLRDTT